MARHAHATTVQAAVHAGDELPLGVADNGRGIDPAITRSSDLTNLPRRVEKFGGPFEGPFELTGRSEVGTRLSWSTPLTHQARPHPLAPARLTGEPSAPSHSPATCVPHRASWSRLRRAAALSSSTSRRRTALSPR
ncbi:hypothetical protein ACFVYM_33050 [Streptomyces sp. NPDC058298]|uniref:hypothetical protein n=1 Tax=Streptomyces sp. NPDC058298 TaxID=3346434 RepID=UPI0036EAFCA1